MRKARSALLGLALGLALATSPVHADGPAPSVKVRVADPPSLSFENTALGRATHPIRLVVTNGGTRAVQLEPLAFRFRPVRDGVTFACEDPHVIDDRWPAALEAGASFTLARELSCETPLPGRYEVDLRGRPRGTADADALERTYGSFSMQIEPGVNPPVHLPWDAALYAAASGTKDMRPTKDPNQARIVVAMINGTRSAVALSPVRAWLRVTRRGSTVAPCPERGVDLAFSGALASGRSQSLPTPLGCDLSAEAVYDVDVSLANASGARVHLATHAIRVGVIPPPPPRPEDTHNPAKIIGGM